MYTVTKGIDFTVNHNSHLSPEIPQSLLQKSGLEQVGWKSLPMNGSVNLGPFSITYELHIADPILDSQFKVAVEVNSGLLGKIKIIDATIDMEHTEVGFDKSGFRAKVVFDISKIELKAVLGAFGHTWEYVIYSYGVSK